MRNKAIVLILTLFIMVPSFIVIRVRSMRPPAVISNIR